MISYLQSIPAVVGMRSRDARNLSAIQTSSNGRGPTSVCRRLQHVHSSSLHRRCWFDFIKLKSIT